MKKWKSGILVLVFLAFLAGYWFSIQDCEIYQNYQNQAQEIEKNVEQNDQEKEYKVLRVIDGDTFEIYYQNHKAKVRVLGINTPEKKNPYRPQECFGEEASKKAEELLKGKKVKIQFDSLVSKYDKFGRILAYVFIDGKEDFGKRMILDGYAYEYTYHGHKYQKQKEYKEAQREAEKNKRGLWADGVCDGWRER